jgi:acyl-coenzyme A synthetase/AMP-(fatty) acid ligase/ubiquinone/menaquinone biosynthesis C-methylase UbiE/acyl carrier protein
MTSSNAGSNDFDDFAQPYQAWVAQQSAAARTQLAQNIIALLPPGGWVLDAGCGDGSLAVALATSAWQVVGLDLSPEMIDLARQKVAAAGVANVHLVLGNLEQLSISRQRFAVVVSSFALHHTPVEMTLPRLAQMVQPGGWLLLLEPTCPVTGPLRPLWYGRQGLRAMAQTAKHQGRRAIWQSLHFQRRWFRHQLADNHHSEARWRALVAPALPGAVLQPTKDSAAIIMMWHRPEPVEVISRPSPPLVSPSTPIQVGRRYPLPPPAAYVPFPRAAIEGSVVARFEEQVTQHESRPALQSGQLQLTYGQLNAAANQGARRLLAQTRRSTAPVAIVMDQDEPVIPAILGVLKTGRPYVVIDPADSPERQARILDMIGAESVLTTVAGIRAVTRARLILWEELGRESTDNPGLTLGADNLAAIFFTSGSTGDPKGVARDQRQLLHSTWLNTNTYYVAPTDRQSLLYFPGFTAAVPNIYDTLLNGATLYPLNPRHLPASTLLRWLREEQITHFNPPIGLWRGLLEMVTPGETWPHLRLITLGGQRLYGKDVRDFQSRFGPDTALLYVLAMTEAGAVTQAYIDHTTVAGDGPVPVGYPVADKQLTILNEQGLPAATGEAGRIAVTSHYLSLGYWHAESRSVTPFDATTAGASGQATFVTSDRGVLRADGGLEHHGREDTVVKVRGYRIDLAAVETVLNIHPQVERAVVLARPRLAGDPMLTAYVVAQPHSRLTAQLLRAFVGQSLSHFMTPERFVFLEAMPLTASGKINPQALPPPGKERPQLDTPFIAPRTDLEQQLADIWAELLDLDEVGVADNFFDLGGDSLLAMRIMVKVEDEFGCRLSPDFFRQPTIVHLAQLITGERKEPATNPIPAMKINRKSGLRHRLMRQSIGVGPVWRGYALPYSLGGDCSITGSGCRSFTSGCNKPAPFWKRGRR